MLLRRSLSTATDLSLQKTNFESASKVVPGVHLSFLHVRVFLKRQAVRILLTPGDRSETLYWDCVIFTFLLLQVVLTMYIQDFINSVVSSFVYWKIWIKQAHKVRRCDSIAPETINHWHQIGLCIMAYKSECPERENWKKSFLAMTLCGNAPQPYSKHCWA